MSYPAFTTCPHCAAKHELASGVVAASERPARPVDGDATLCITCGCWSIFDTTAVGGLRLPTTAELGQIGSDPKVNDVTRAWQDMNRHRARQ